MTIHVAVHITTLPGRAQEQVDAFTLIADAVRAESGCIRYDLHRVTNHDDQFLLLEEWQSANDLAQHDASAMMAEASVRHAVFRAGIAVLELGPAL